MWLPGILDSHPLALAGFVSQVTFTLTLTLLAWSDQRSIGTRWLAGACALELLGTAVHPFVELGGNPLLRGLDRALVVVVLYLLYLGLRWFTVRRPLGKRTGPLLVAASVVVIALVALHSAGEALALSRIASLIVMSFTLAALSRVRYPALRRSARVLAVLVGAFIVLFMFRLSLDVGLLGIAGPSVQASVRSATVAIFSMLAFASVAMFAAESKRRLHQESREDGLTGLANRRFIDETAEYEIRRVRRHGWPLTLLMLDLDHFKKLNDTFGHDIGDCALRSVARVLLEALGPNDFGARLGGEEFAVLLPGRDLESAAFLGERLRRAVEALREPSSEGPVSVTVSIGVSQFAPGEATWESMLRRADKALYQAKREGRNRVVLWPASREADGMDRKPDSAVGLQRRQNAR